MTIDADPTGWTDHEREFFAAGWNECLKMQPGFIERLRTALVAVDTLWSADAALGFEQEMSPPSPVGLVWQQVKAALAFQQESRGAADSDTT